MIKLPIEKYKHPPKYHENTPVTQHKSLDPFLYRSLMYMKKLEGGGAGGGGAEGGGGGESVEDLAVTFSVDRSVGGTTHTVDLIPNGRHITVTNSTRMRFIYLIANYKVSQRARGRGGGRGGGGLWWE